MENILRVVRELQADSTKKGKESILRRNSDNTDLQKFIKYVLDDSFVYGIQDKKLNKFLVNSYDNTPFAHLFEVFEYLLKKNTGDDHTVEQVASFINTQPDHMKEFYVEAITKKLRMGIDKTVSKVFPDLIEQFEVMRAKSFHDYKDKVKDDFSISEKYNGIRCITEKKDGVITNKTRQNKVILGLNDINKELAQLPDGIWEGELVVKNSEQYRLREVLQETMKIVNSDDEDKVVDYWIFDYLTEDEFKAGKSTKKYFDRRDSNPANNTNFDSVKAVSELYRGNDATVIDSLLDELVDIRGREGLMYYQDKFYENKRTSNILKVKKKYTSDLKVIGFIEGNGKYKGKLGALLLDYKGFELGCSGMTDEQRIEIWSNQDKYLGVIVEVEHEQQSSNEKGGLSVEYPAFIQWRFDKDEVNYAHE